MDARNKLADGFWPLLERAFEGILLAEPNPWRVVYANRAAAEWFGATPSQLVGRAIETLFAEASKSALLGRLDDSLRAPVGNASNEPLRSAIVSTEESTEIVEIRCCRLVLDDAVLVGVLLDNVVTGRSDPLTALRDRNYLYSRLFPLLTEADHRFAVLFIDLDNFKSVNDRHGHLVGDCVLFECAKRLMERMGTTHSVVRYGGDEFIVLVEHFGNAAELESLAEGIRNAIAPPIPVPDGEVRLSASVGIAVSSPEFRTPNDVLAAADRAMYAAKRN